MRVHSIREGHATNSSSSHSIICIPDGMEVPHDKVTGDYGWERFTLSSRREKATYMAYQLARNLYGVQEKRAKVAEKYVYDATGEKVEVCEDDWSGIDHESVMSLPSAFGATSRDPVNSFFQNLLTYVMRDDVVILGGNDNGGEHFLVEALGAKSDDWSDEGERQEKLRQKELGFGFFSNMFYVEHVYDAEQKCPSVVCRYDPQYHFWTLYAPSTGKKIRVSFAPKLDTKYAVTRASAPELVDLKITDYCTRGCKYCYQSSTAKGEHASLESVTAVLRDLADAHVFEVALGGGEPTQHPDFCAILRAAKELGITPNFSTARVEWMLNESVVAAVKECCGAFAVSVDESGRYGLMQEACWYAKETGLKSKLRYQYVMGSAPREWFCRTLLPFVRNHQVGLTLLAPKSKGLGGAAEWHAFSGWLKDVKAAEVYRFGIDTALAAMSVEALQGEGVDARYYEVEEGRFSMYIDAVHGRAGPSSFCDEGEMVDYLGDTREVFGGFGV